MSLLVVNDAVKVTDQAVIDALQAYMGTRHSATGAEVVAAVPALSGLTRPQQEQAVIDSGYRIEET